MSYYRGKRVLVTGGAGFVGTHLIRHLAEGGAHVRATLHEKPPQLSLDTVEWVKGDLLDNKFCQETTRDIELVFMCAANTSGAGVMTKSPMVHVTPNVVMNTQLLDAAYQNGVGKTLFISSNTVYPNVTHAVTEDEMQFGNLYEKYFCVGWMKQFTEVLCQMYSEKLPRSMPCVVVRPANIYGPNDDFEWETSHVLPALVRKVVERHAPLEVWGDGNDIKDFIYIEDFIRGILAAMEHGSGYDPLNIGSGLEISIKQALATMLEEDDFRDARVVFNSRKPTMIPRRVINVEKANRTVGFEATTPFKEGIRRTITWYRTTKEKALS
jgi:GDP-L-fucose synthase